MGSIQHQKIIFLASNKCLLIQSVYSEVGIVTDDILVIVFYGLF
jgi:hypothetical protein